MRDVRTALVTSILVLVALFGVSVVVASHRVSSEGLLRVTFLDVGQGDATLIESPSGTKVLIDGGRDSSVLGGLQKELGYFDKDIDMIVATHPDADHITGLTDVLKRYTVHNILLTENKSDTSMYKAFLSAVATEVATGAKMRYARAGQVYELGVGDAGTTTLRILFPDVDPTDMESNMSSIVAQLSYGDSDYVLTGDSPIEIEKYLVGKEGATLQSEVLKAGHHGSRTSSSEEFVSMVAPVYAIYSSGKNNSYGHPHKEVVDRFTAHGVIQKNTADEGTIKSLTNGVTLWFK